MSEWYTENMNNFSMFASFVIGGIIGCTVGYLYASYSMMKNNLEHISQMCMKRAAEKGTPLHDPKNT